RTLDIALAGKIPLVRNLTIRKISSSGTAEAMALVVTTLTKTTDPNDQLEQLRSINDGLKGTRQAPMPEAWPGLFAKLTKSENAEVRSQATALAITFGDANAFETMRKTLANVKADIALRQSALAALVGTKDKDLPPVLQKLLAEPALRSAALKGLAAY